MVRFILSKFFYMIVSLFILISVTFVLMKAIPGNPFMSEKAVPPSIQQHLMAKYGLDKPLYEQYLKYLGNLARGDFGISMKMKDQGVSDLIWGSFGPSLRLGIIAIVVSIVVGIGLGMLAALYHRKLIDNVAMILAVIGMSVPSFVLASLLQFYLAQKAGIFKVMGLNGPLDYVLPVMALSAQPIAFIARLARSSMLEVLHSEYIKTAKAKGLAWPIIMWRHVIRNGIMPVVTYVGPMTANIITGSVVIEQIFGIGGLGKIFVSSISNRDYTLIMGVTIFYGIILMVARLLTDIAYAFIDPRIKLSKGKEG
ncbi:ABC transporter permease [Paenibacillus sediminis]|uniref:Oligopeptide transport system permease protein n=1 Tax=Paenibacillus sediminis TaxID=664909 RepID=A0ABS4GYU6_9BACL|nr:ABC transporter permease [Paenibacillus sediminis]MBP1935439.1 oligopeptide transport system permease protein [Paenibacillus sediminis]